MKDISEKNESVRSEIVELNQRFHDKELLSDSFYEQLLKLGFVYCQCVLVNIFPDSGNTYCGIIIKQDGSVLEFDVDLDTPGCSRFSDITDSFQKMRTERSKTKSWKKVLIAFDFFQKTQAGE